MEIIVDIDGTVADCTHRLWLIEKKPKDYNKFHDNCKYDEPIWPIVDMLRTLHRGGANLIYCTGRPISHLEETINWLDGHGLKNDYISSSMSMISGLYMRKAGDHRPDIIVKKELYYQMRKEGWNPSLVLEDRTRCVEMWRSLGLKCLQVEKADY